MVRGEEKTSDQEKHAKGAQEHDNQLWLATLQEAQGPSPITSMSQMVFNKAWNAELEKKRAGADLMCWDYGVPKYCDIERTIKAPKDSISSVKLEWLAQRHFGVSKLSEFYLFL